MNDTDRFKFWIRRTAAALFFYSGAAALRHRVTSRDRVLVLMYHRVIDPTDLDGIYIQPGIYVTRETFEMQMRYLARYFRVVSMEELLEAVKKGIQPKEKTCVVTFDDGWRDTYTNAYPILKKYGIHATVFLATSYIGTTRWPWPEQLSYLAMNHKVTQQAIQVSAASDATLGRVTLMICSALSVNPSPQVGQIDALIEALKPFPVEVIHEALDRIYHVLGLSAPSDRLFMNWDEVKTMSQDGITFGSHTCTHRILTGLSLEEVRKELKDSMSTIQKKIINFIPVFSYPNGDYNPEIQKLVRECGYEAAVTTRPGPQSHTGPEDMFGFRRIGIHNDMSSTVSLFAWHISGLEHALQARLYSKHYQS